MKIIDRYIENCKKIKESEDFIFDEKKEKINEAISFFQSRAYQNFFVSISLLITYFMVFIEVPDIFIYFFCVMKIITIFVLGIEIEVEKKKINYNLLKRVILSTGIYALTIGFMIFKGYPLFSIVMVTSGWFLFSGVVSFFTKQKIKKKYASSFQYWNKNVLPIMKEQEKIKEFVIKDEEIILSVLEYSETISHCDHFYFYGLYREKIEPIYEYIDEKEVSKIELQKEKNRMLITTE